MAEGTLFDLSKRIIKEASNLVGQEIGLLNIVKGEIEKLSDTVSTIGAILRDAEAKQHNNEVKVWLENLRDAMFDADDILDDISTEALRREEMARNNKKAKEVRIFFSKSNQLAYGLKMGHKIKAMRERLDAIAVDRKELPEERQQIRYKAREQTNSSVHAEDVVGREYDKNAIIGSLLNDLNPNVNVLILPIVGIGGVGKTTLAQLVFNDEEINKRFEQKKWVCVSHNFDVDTFINGFKEEIDGKRYLLVLDDLWNDDYDWRLKDFLMSGARGSRILVTTREEKVAENLQTIQPYFLKGLNEYESWILFKQMVFENRHEPGNSKIKGIGMEILAKCRGVPLAIRTIGRQLYNMEEELHEKMEEELHKKMEEELHKNMEEELYKKMEEEFHKNMDEVWLSFKDSELSKVPQQENDILPTLKLSYDCLPPHLKQCFEFFCLFPKDYKFCKPTLIKMWMAQDFMMHSDQNQCLEDVGHEYFMDLLGRSFFQEVEKDEYGDILRFKIHGLMHDLAKFVASKSVISDPSKEIIDENTLHVSFGGVSLSQIPISLFEARRIKEASRIKTFMLQGQLKDMDKSIYGNIVASFHFIFLLDLHNIRIQTIPSSIRNLKQLRYLDLRYNSCIEMLPNSITKLQNLQTLRLFGCSKLRELPKDIKNLVNLKYLEIDECEDLTHMPRGLGKLTNLRTLSKFVINKNTSSVFRRSGGLNELFGLNELRGTLEIWGLRHGKDAALESKDANLKDKSHLQCLVLKWIELDVDELNDNYDEKSLEALQPHQNLKELSLDGYRAMKFPCWISTLTNLVRLSLHNCNKWQHLPPLDGFHSLKSLKSLNLFGLGSLECISKRDYNSKELPDSSFLLEELTISYCPNLKGWWSEPQRRDSIEESSTIDSMAENHLWPSFRCLSKVCICGCPKLTSMPLYQFPSLKVLELNSLPDLEYISNSEEFFNSSFLQSLEELKLKYCPNLKGWWRRRDSMEEVNDDDNNSSVITTATTSMVENHLPPFPCLSKLCIRGCPQLISMPFCPILEKLELYNCSFKPLEQTARIAAAEASASSSSSSTLATSSFASLRKLKSLEIGRMEEPLPEECMQNLISLDRLCIYECRGPLLQGMRHLTALKQLGICSSEVFNLSKDGNEMEWQSLRSLSTLWLFQLQKLKSLPVGLQYVTSLQKLTIDHCPCLMEIPEWICSLTSLEILEIVQCPKLMSLPEGISRLTSLHTLKICYCPILLQRCKEIPDLYLKEGNSDGEPS